MPKQLYLSRFRISLGKTEVVICLFQYLNGSWVSFQLWNREQNLVEFPAERLLLLDISELTLVP